MFNKGCLGERGKHWRERAWGSKKEEWDEEVFSATLGRRVEGRRGSVAQGSFIGQQSGQDVIRCSIELTMELNCTMAIPLRTVLHHPL
jgi:hypothetical protein